MKIQYLGTAAAEGWPGLFCRCAFCEAARRLSGKDIRTRSQALIDGQLLVDFPPDTLLHALQHGVPLPDIRHLIVTHSHHDHFFPQDLLMRRRPYTATPDGVLTVYGNAAVGDALARERRNLDSELYVEFAQANPFEWFETGAHRVLPLLATHARDEQCYVYIIERGDAADAAPRRIAYLNDTGLLPDASLRALSGLRCDLISMDCTTGRDPDGNNHMGIADIPKMIAQLREVGCATDASRYVITHFSHNGGYLHHQLEALAAEMNATPAYDGMIVEI